MKNNIVAPLLILLCSIMNLNIVSAQSTGQLVQLENSFCKIYAPIHEKDYIYVIDSCNCKKGFFSGNATLNVYKQEISAESSFWPNSTIYDTTTTLVYKLTGNFENGYLEGDATYWKSGFDDEITHKELELKGCFKHGHFPHKAEIKYVNINLLEDTCYYVGEVINTLSFGKGIYTYSDGTILDGIFVHDNIYDGYRTDNSIDTFCYFWRGTIQYDSQPDGYNIYPTEDKEYTAYFDQYFNPCEKKNAVYYWSGIYKIPHVNDETILLYYCQNKALAAKLQVKFVDYQNLKNSYFDGKQWIYYPNGKLRQEVIARQNYILDSLRVYNENGDIIANSKKLNDGNILLVQLDTGKTHYYFFDKNKLGKASFLKENDSCSIHKHLSAKTDAHFLKDYISILQFDDNWFADMLDNELDYSQYDIPLDIDGAEELSDVNYSFTTYYTKQNGDKKSFCGIAFTDYDDNYYAFLLKNNEISFAKYNSKGKVIEKYFSADCQSVCADTNAFRMVRKDDNYYFYLNDSLFYQDFYLSDREVLSVQSKWGDYTRENYDVVMTPQTDDKDDMAAVDEIISLLNSIANNSDSIVEDNKLFDATGTGFFIHEDGYLLTAQHVIDHYDQIIIETDLITEKMKDYAAEVVLVDKKNDLALLKIKDKSFHLPQSVPFVFDTNELDLGEVIFAMGYPNVNPMGKSIKYTEGVINSTKGYKDESNSYQISATVQQGNSGCPIFNAKGEVIGVAEAALVDRGTFENVNYCIKAKYIIDLIKSFQDDFQLPNNTEISNMSRTQKIKLLSKYIVLIKTK